jgi:Fur family zinc uptake transcriptional regulator
MLTSASQWQSQKVMKQKQELTRNQRLVFETLVGAGTPLSAYALLDELRPEGLRAPLQIYRALEKLIEQGLVHRLETVNAFVACSRPHDHAHETVAFTICERCGRVEEFADGTVAHRLADLARDRKFRIARTTIELRGTCAGCLAPAGDLT